MHFARPTLDSLVIDLASLDLCLCTPFAPPPSPLAEHLFESAPCSWFDCARSEEDGWPYSDHD